MAVIGAEKGKRSTLGAAGVIKDISRSLFLGAASFLVLNVAISYCSDVKKDPLRPPFSVQRARTDSVSVLNGIYGGLAVGRGLQHCLL